jgi:hypothetical protein
MKISKTLRAALAATLLMGLCGAAGATTCVSPCSLGSSTGGNGSPGLTVNYLDIFTFTDAATPPLSGALIDDKWYFTELVPFYLVDAGVSFTFFKDVSVSLVGPGGVLWTSGVVSGPLVTIPYLLMADVGTWYIEVVGTSTKNTANYSGAGQVVPLPAAAWLLLSGLAGLGAMARRRKVAAEA